MHELLRPTGDEMFDTRAGRAPAVVASGFGPAPSHRGPCRGVTAFRGPRNGAPGAGQAKMKEAAC